MSEESTTKKKNWFARHKILTVILIIILLGIIGSASSGNKKSATTKANTNTAASSNAQPIKVEPVATPSAKPMGSKVYTGTGDDVVDIQKPDNTTAIASFECTNCTENTVLKINGAEGLLVNTIGAYSGSHLIDAHDGSNTSQATITANGSWKLTISDITTATQVNGQAVNGTGDTVLHITGNTTKATLTNTGDENFVVNVYPENGGSADLAVNTIGAYKGTVPLSTPAYVQIESNGNWTLTPQ